MQDKRPGHPNEHDDVAESRYWRRSLRLVAGLLAVWFGVSFGCGILLRDVLDRFTLPGTRFPLGFWFAQQGAILVFVALIGAYVLLAAGIDRDLESDRAAQERPDAAGSDATGTADGAPR